MSAEMAGEEILIIIWPFVKSSIESDPEKESRFWTDSVFRTHLKIMHHTKLWFNGFRFLDPFTISYRQRFLSLNTNNSILSLVRLNFNGEPIPYTIHMYAIGIRLQVKIPGWRTKKTRFSSCGSRDQDIDLSLSLSKEDRQIGPSNIQLNIKKNRESW